MSGPCFSSSVGGHPLRSPTRRRLGKPLPYQLADGTQAPPEANKSFRHRFLNPMTSSGISSPFGLLFQTSGQVTNAILTRSPLRSSASSEDSSKLSVRLACIRHAASVHPEPGSNSSSFSLHPVSSETGSFLAFSLTLWIYLVACVSFLNYGVRSSF